MVNINKKNVHRVVEVIFINVCFSSFTNIQTAHWSSYTKIVQKLRIPDQPKQPKSAFLRFVVDIKGEIQYETVNDLAREASIQWKQLPEEQKKKYCDASEEEFVSYP